MPTYLRLRVAAEAYAMPVEFVREVFELGRVEAVPGARPEILGVRNVRGQIVPVADLAPLLGLARAVPPGRLLLAEAGGRQAGLAVDEVSGVSELPELAEETQSDLLVGTAFADGELTGVIDMPRVFDALEGMRP
jgi:two-component system chemotaxis response regulator CheV